MLTLLFSIIIFGILIGVHEAGHLIAAKKCGVLVHEFSIGMGPKIFSFTKGETLYSLRLIPIGGFCAMEGEDSESTSSRAFCNIKPIKKIIVLVSGALMNILLGFLAICVLFSFSKTLPTTYVEAVKENTSAYSQGIKQGDKIIEINNRKVIVYSDISFNLQLTKNENVAVKVLRDGKELMFNITPYQEDGGYYLGVTLASQENSFINLISYSFKQMLFIVRMVLTTLGMLITGGISFKETSGPVGIVSVINQVATGEVGKGMFLNILNIISLISINLGIFNLIPLPALDGGRTTFALFELITKKKISPKVEGAINSIGLIALLVLMIFVTYNDIVRIM